MESLFIQIQKIDPYDWFCGSGSHLVIYAGYLVFAS